MTEKELKKLNRVQLLELLLDMAARLERTSAELEAAGGRIAAAEHDAAEQAAAASKEAQARIEEIQKDAEERIAAAEEEAAKAKGQLADKTILIDQAGSIAEASLQLSGVFLAAQGAAQQYLENIERLSARQEEVCARREEESRARAARVETEKKAKAEALLAEAEEKCRKMEAETRAKCDAMTAKARLDSEKYWTDVSAKMRQLLEAHSGLQSLFERPEIKL